MGHGTATVARPVAVHTVTLRTRGPGLAPTRRVLRGLDPADADDLVALGTFHVGADGHATVMLPTAVNPARLPGDRRLGEPDGGPAAHSGVSVLRSRATPG